jgi:hypothetical protein
VGAPHRPALADDDLDRRRGGFRSSGAAAVGYPRPPWTTSTGSGLWLDLAGSPLTSAARVTERIRRPRYGRLEIEVTVNDPKAYTKPWTVRLDQAIVVDTELLDSICLENEQSTRRMVGK